MKKDEMMDLRMEQRMWRRGIIEDRERKKEE